MVLRLKSLGVSAAALGISSAVHAAVLFTPVGHPAGNARDEGSSIDVTTELLPPPEVPAMEPAADRPASHPTHTHPYPVPPSHDWIPHDPNLEHPHAPPAPATPDLPAQAAPVVTASDDTPSFTITVSTSGDDAHGAVSAAGSAQPHEESGEPLAEPAVDGKARLVRGLAPSYPEAARTAGVEGDVHLELVVGVSGSVESARVVQGIGHGLDEAALQAVRQFRFAPATKDGRAVRVRMGWSMQFRLQ